jgi:hypothetical protein
MSKCILQENPNINKRQDKHWRTYPNQPEKTHSRKAWTFPMHYGKRKNSL